MARISIIIPLYNKENCIARTISSVLSQSFVDYELIIVNDGSTDNSLMQLLQFNDSRIKIITQENSGPGAARNVGLNLASSPYIAFLDADDEWNPAFLTDAYKTLSEKNNLVYVSNHYLGEGSQNYLSQHPNIALDDFWMLSITEKVENIKNYVDLLHSSAVVTNTDLIRRYGGFYEKGASYGEDSFLWLKVVFNEKIFVNKSPLVRLHYDYSELGFKRKEHYPTYPILLEKDAILGVCKQCYLNLARQTLDYYALISLRRHLVYGNSEELKLILKNFPIGGYSRMKFYKIMLLYYKLLFTSLVRKNRSK